MFRLLLLAVALLWPTVPLIHGYKMFQERIPNGGKVPHPCFPNYLWDGVGHENSQGGSLRNRFGLDFAANGYNWTRALCEKDSDGDGLTNGQELGDPECVWTPGTLLTSSTPLSHPGVCEPLTSDTCKARNDWEFCTKPEFNCSETSKEGVQNITIRFPPTPVPATETNYMCMLFDVPHDVDYHIVAGKPIIDNKNVMHHLIVYACKDDPDDVMEKYRTVQSCGMESTGICGSIVVLWTLGGLGSCNTGNSAFRFGRSIYKKFLVQVHWTNTALRTDFIDSSGMIIYYTPKLRPHDLGWLTVGPMHLYIPKGQELLEESGTCPASCTTKFVTQNMKIISAALHMHYLGRGGSLEQYRDGKKIATLISNDAYSYDNPSSQVFDPPVEVRPGDELKVSCRYKSTSRSGTVYYGQSTLDEMCFAFMEYHPKMDFALCMVFGKTALCDSKMEPNTTTLKFGDCQLKGEDPELTGAFIKLFSLCDQTGQKCNPGCKSFLEGSPHPCLSGDAKYLLEFMLPHGAPTGAQMTKMLRSCDAELYAGPTDPPVSGIADGRRDFTNIVCGLVLVVINVARLM